MQTYISKSYILITHAVADQKAPERSCNKTNTAICSLTESNNMFHASRLTIFQGEVQPVLLSNSDVQRMSKGTDTLHTVQSAVRTDTQHSQCAVHTAHSAHRAMRTDSPHAHCILLHCTTFKCSGSVLC